uniref:Uncharacterized protein n=1 Tax=Populus trichocarpa x Populus deltoides TaxID=3695 RepID=A9PJC3_9ROSI|nr:unknown [Populus trichocarpa x Populus deltoides]
MACLGHSLMEKKKKTKRFLCDRLQLFQESNRRSAAM